MQAGIIKNSHEGQSIRKSSEQKVNLNILLKMVGTNKDSATGKKLANLWENLEHKEENNINKFITFKMIKEASEEYTYNPTSQFQAIINASETGITKTISYCINELPILTNHLSDEEAKFISKFVNHFDGRLNDATIKEISQEYKPNIILESNKPGKKGFLNELFHIPTLNNKPSDKKIRQLLFNNLKLVNKTITFSSTAAYLNGMKRTDIREIELNAKFREQNTSNLILENCIKSHIGNCGELAIILFNQIFKDKNIPDSIKNDLHIATLDNCDHVFLSIGKINSEESLIIDPWIKYIDMPIMNGFRNKELKANNCETGFIGTKQEFLHFMNSHKEFLELGGKRDYINIEQTEGTKETEKYTRALPKNLKI
jgi:hypothetical protein